MALGSGRAEHAEGLGGRGEALGAEGACDLPARLDIRVEHGPDDRELTVGEIHLSLAVRRRSGTQGKCSGRSQTYRRITRGAGTDGPLRGPLPGQGRLGSPDW